MVSRTETKVEIRVEKLCILTAAARRIRERLGPLADSQGAERLGKH